MLAYICTQSKINTTELGCFIVWIFFPAIVAVAVAFNTTLLRVQEKKFRYKDKYRLAYTAHVHSYIHSFGANGRKNVQNSFFFSRSKIFKCRCAWIDTSNTDEKKRKNPNLYRECFAIFMYFFCLCLCVSISLCLLLPHSLHILHVYSRVYWMDGKNAPHIFIYRGGFRVREIGKKILVTTAIVCMSECIFSYCKCYCESVCVCMCNSGKGLMSGKNRFLKCWVRARMRKKMWAHLSICYLLFATVGHP